MCLGEPMGDCAGEWNPQTPALPLTVMEWRVALTALCSLGWEQSEQALVAAHQEVLSASSASPAALVPSTSCYRIPAVGPPLCWPNPDQVLPAHASHGQLHRLWNYKPRWRCWRVEHGYRRHACRGFPEEGQWATWVPVPKEAGWPFDLDLGPPCNK